MDTTSLLIIADKIGMDISPSLSENIIGATPTRSQPPGPQFQSDADQLRNSSIYDVNNLLKTKR
jgi:hypothetical protein